MKNECTKEQFDKKTAKTALNYIKKHRRDERWHREKRYYHCSKCNMWHLTSKEKQRAPEK